MKVWHALLYLMMFFSTLANALPQAKNVQRPKLVVGLVIDQMRWDYLYRFQNRYGKDGFMRLLGGGLSCENTFINYLPSYTAAGHTAIYSGAVPAISGITGNDWIDNRTGRKVYCTQDDRQQSIGGSVAAGRMSPVNMHVSTVADELRLGTNFRSRTFGIAIKDRGAILPAGHSANAAYWYDDSSGNFITSSYYMQQLPVWLQMFNDRHLTDSLASQGWRLSYQASTYTGSTADSNRYEGLAKGERAAIFPHQPVGKISAEIRFLPWGNTLSFMMAKECISKEQLGNTGSTDFLALSLSSTDYIGHRYGPNSIEVEDMYLKLDKELASFLRFLDDHIGKGQYLIILSADHGAAHNAGFLADNHLPGGIISESVLARELNEHLKTKFGIDSIVSAVINYQVFLNEQAIIQMGTRRNAIKDEIMNFCRGYKGIAYATDAERLSEMSLPADLKDMVMNGYNATRSGNIFLLLQPGYYSSFEQTGTTHGSWAAYDRHIPLLWYGWHIQPGKIKQLVSITDIAPTLSTLLQIQQPNGSYGNNIF